MTYKNDNVYFDTSGTNNWLELMPEGWKLKIERIKGIDELTLIIEPKSFNKETEYNVACKLKEELGIRFNVCLERNCFSDHKLKRIIDLRKK